jgi:hypothetical protein
MTLYGGGMTMNKAPRKPDILTKNSIDINDKNAESKSRKSLTRPEASRINSDEPLEPVWGDDLPDWMRKL